MRCPLRTGSLTVATALAVAALPALAPAANPHRAAPHVQLRVAKRTTAQLLAAGKVEVTVTVDRASRMRLQATIPLTGAPRPLVLGTTRVRFARAGTRTVAIVLTRAGRRTLQRHRMARVTVRVRATDAAAPARHRRTRQG